LGRKFIVVLSGDARPVSASTHDAS
jgi:hypothetical protein